MGTLYDVHYLCVSACRQGSRLSLSAASFEALWSFVLTSKPQPASTEPSSPPSSSSPLRNEIPVYANHPFSPEFCASLSKIPQSLSNMAISGVLSVQIVRVIGNIPRTMPASVSDSSVSPGSITSPDLHSILVDLLRLGTLQTTKMEHLLCYGLVAYCLPLQYEHPLPASTTGTLSTCVDAYMRHSPNDEQMDRKCLIWIAVMIASALDLSADRSFAKYTVLDQALSRYPEARNASDMVQILQSFLWHDDLAPQWKATWQTVVDRRRKSSTTSATPSPSTSSPSARAIPLESLLIQETGKGD